MAGTTTRYIPDMPTRSGALSFRWTPEHLADGCRRTSCRDLGVACPSAETYTDSNARVLIISRFSAAIWPAPPAISTLGRRRTSWDGGIFGEYVYLPAPKWRLIVGARVDFVDAGANPGPTERMQYRSYYGDGADEVDAFETNVSANTRLVYSPLSSLDLFVGVGRAARTADATERYLALGPGPGGFYIGNPGLDPEESFEVDTGIHTRWGRLAVDGALFYNRIEDYILQYILDRAFQCPHGPCNLRGFRNIDHATLLGADLGLSYALRENLSLHGSFAYVHGENEEDDRALPEIPPLEGRLGLRYEHPHWGLWFNPVLRLAQSQHRVDTAFGEDTTQGHVTVDIGAGWRLFGRHELMLHIENLFDKNYNEHITRENPFTGREVFEPGRVVTIGLRTTF